MKKKKTNSESKKASQKLKLGVGKKFEDVATPPDLLEEIRERWGEFFDPCPLGGREAAEQDKTKDGLLIDWQEVNFINPPFQEIERWIRKGVLETQKKKLDGTPCNKKCIFLVAARTNTKYWRNLVIPHATDLEFFFDRIKFEEGSSGLPIPVCLIEFDPTKPPKFREEQLGKYTVWKS